MNEASKLSVPCSSMTCLNALGMLSEKRVCTNQTWRGKPTHCTYVWRQRSERSLSSTLYITFTEAGRLMDTATSQQNITDSIRLEKASESIESNITVSITECHLQPFPWTTSLSVQCLITLLIKKSFLIPKLNLPWRSLKLCPLVLSKQNSFPLGHQRSRNGRWMTGGVASA